MLQQILSATPEPFLAGALGPLLAMAGFGAYHGLNPGMGWLFALSLGLQRESERAIWLSMLPIAAGHAASLLLVAVLVLAGAQFISTSALQLATASLLIAFGLYKVFNYYRHPRWVGLKVSGLDLVWWSFLMATAHGAGLMIAPLVLTLASPETAMPPTAEAAMDHGAAAGAHAMPGMAASAGLEVSLGLLVHTAAMLIVMAVIAWVVYKRFGLAILRQHWVNFDLIWAVALLVVGIIALLGWVGVF